MTAFPLFVFPWRQPPYIPDECPHANLPGQRLGYGGCEECGVMVCDNCGGDYGVDEAGDHRWMCPGCRG